MSPRVEAAAQALSGVAAPEAVFVGEVHDRLPYHVNQLAAIAALRESGAKVAVGLEMIQVPFQSHLDDYVAGRIDLREMLRRTEYYTRWRFDARLYQPILEYARRHGLPLVALNAARELTDRVRTAGIDGLDPDERAALPASITPPAPGYRALLEEVFREHPDQADANIDRFIEIQLTWDETMAMTGARFLDEHPDHVLVVLAGVKHVAHGHGIPVRLRARADVEGLVVLGDREREEHPDSADVYLELVDAELTAPGRMGVMIRPASEGAVVDGFADGSPAEAAGVEVDDVIVAVDGHPVGEFADLKVALFDRAPGDAVSVTVRRRGEQRLDVTFELY